MKRCSAIIVMLGFIILTPPISFAQHLKLGVVTDQRFGFSPFLWTLGGEFGIRFDGGNTSSEAKFELAPEMNVTFYKFDFQTMWLAPALMLNYGNHDRNVNWAWVTTYVGFGITKAWQIGPDVPNAPSTGAALKIHAGIHYGSESSGALAIFLITPFNAFFNQMSIGVTLII